MTKSICYQLSVEECEELLQNALDDPGIRLKRIGDFFAASSDDLFLDGLQVDKQIA